jgi:hypothetical protein
MTILDTGVWRSPMKPIIIPILMLLLRLPRVLAQEDVVFVEQEVLDTITKPAQPIIGYAALSKLIEAQVSEGDTLGKKYRVELWSLGIKISKSGAVDSAFVRINHASCGIHRRIAAELMETVWEPAREKGVAVAWEGEIYERIYVNRRVLKKYNCTRSFGEWLLAPLIN